MKFSDKELKDFLEEKTLRYNSSSFISDDPISIPHRFSKKEDIEISGFFSAVIAWGNRKAIVAAGSRLAELMDNSPHEFILHHSPADLNRFKKFVHRTFNGGDAIYFIRSLKNIYKNHGGMESIFQRHISLSDADLSPALSGFKAMFYILPGARTQKHYPHQPLLKVEGCVFMYITFHFSFDYFFFPLFFFTSCPPFHSYFY